MQPKVTNFPKQIALLRSWSFSCVWIYKDLAPPEPFFHSLLGHGRYRPGESGFWLIWVWPLVAARVPGSRGDRRNRLSVNIAYP